MPLDGNRSPGDNAPGADMNEQAALHEALLDAVRSFARHEIGSRRTRPECALTADDLNAIAHAAEMAGLLDAGDVSESGAEKCGDGADSCGLWSSLLYAAPDSEGPSFTLAALQMLASADAAAAWHLHSLALGRTAQYFAGISVRNDTAFMLDGTHGIGRSALGRLLANQSLHASDSALLADTFGDRARTVLIAPGTPHIAALCWQAGAMQIQIHEVATASIIVDKSPHGIDGCHAVQWIAGNQPLASGVLTINQLRTLITAQQLAQVAIARGALIPAAQRAQDYAHLRKQGARIIAMHDAVALLLADIDTAGVVVDTLLKAAGSNHPDVAQALAIRREAMPLLARAANAAMQVHGGVGYMRDTGVEHVLRTINALRLMGGTPNELALVSAGMSSRVPGVALAVPADDEKDDGSRREKLNSDCVKNPSKHLPESRPNHLPGFLPRDHRLSPDTAFRRVPLLRALTHRQPLDPWEIDTRSLPASLAKLRRRVRHFAERECAPIAALADREQLSGHVNSSTLQALVQRAALAGLLTDILPAPFGSAPPAQFLHSLAFQQALRVEELAHVDGGLMLLLSAHSLGICPLLLSGDSGLLRRVLLPAFRQTQAGDPQIFAFAITEPASGSDAEEGHGALQQTPGVRAKRAGGFCSGGSGGREKRSGGERSSGGWLLNGRKIFISGGDIARYVSVFAALDGEGYDSWTCFLVDTKSPGFRVARSEMKMGMRASGAAELEFDNCFVPDNMIVGGLRNGWALARATLNLSRLPVAAMGVGFAQQAVDIATDFACREKLAGRPLVHYRHVQATLADLQAETGAIRQLTWHHARGWRPRQDGAALCKFQATDRAQVVVEAAMDLLGNAAIRHDQRIERTFRDVRLTRIFEGTNQINRLAVIEEQQSLLLARITGHIH